MPFLPALKDRASWHYFGEHPVQPEHVPALDQRRPTVEVSPVRLTGDTTTQPLQIALDRRPPLLQTGPGQV